LLFQFYASVVEKGCAGCKNHGRGPDCTDLCSLLSVLEEIVVNAEISCSKDSKEALSSLLSSEREIREVLAQSICRAEISELAVK